MALLFPALALAACATANPPIQVSVSQMHPYAAAKPSGCAMPVLAERPARHFDELAIVEGWAGSQSQEQELLQQLKDRACAIGADALLITTSTEQQNARRNSLEVADEIANEADKRRQSVHDVQLNTYKAILASASGAPGTAGHRGFYINSFAIKFKPDKETR